MSRRRKRRAKRKAVIPALLLGILLGVIVLGIVLLVMTKTGIIRTDRNRTAQTAAGQKTEDIPEKDSLPAETEETQKAAETEKSSAQPSTEKISETEPQTEAGPLVVIDAGHQGPGQDMSGTEPIGPGSQEMKARIVTGTQGTTTGLAEYELNLSVALLLQKELESRGYRVLMTRTTQDIDISNIERADVANRAGADIMVRIHANGSEDSSVAGALTMIPSAANPYVGSLYDSCYSLASCILNAYCQETGIANDGIMETDDMTGINWCQMPVTIVEMGFMTNPNDDTYMADEANQAVMAAGIANGIDQYFGR